MSTIDRKTGKKKKNTAIKLMKSDYVFLTFVTLALFAFFIIVLYPLLYVFSASFSGGVMAGGGLSLIPARVTMEGYNAVFEQKTVWSGYANSLLYMVTGTAVALVVTILCAYPLSRRTFKNGKVVMALCIFTMYFSGGMIPTYLTIRNYNMLNTIWALILPGSLSVYNMIVMRTYFNTSIPDEMREAAQIDGCGEWRFLLQIVLPLSGPILAVIGLYYAVDLWNSYYGALLYISDKSKLPLANVLRELLVQSQSLSMESNVTLDSTTQALMEKRAEVMRYSLIIVSSLPVMCLYPFVQKYFVKGVMIGAVKG